MNDFNEKYLFSSADWQYTSELKVKNTRVTLGANFAIAPPKSEIPLKHAREERQITSLSNEFGV